MSRSAKFNLTQEDVFTYEAFPARLLHSSGAMKGFRDQAIIDNCLPAAA
jgi:hypothetical protein